MSILFSAIVRGGTVLAQYAACTGKFCEAMNQLLTIIPAHDNKMTYSIEQYLFHYMVENKLIYICIAESDLPQGDAFAFLNEIKRIFVATFADTPQTSKLYASPNHPKYIEFMGILENRMASYKAKKQKVSLDKVKNELADLKNVMMENVHKVALRGERLDVLLARADTLSQTGVTFGSTARRVQRRLWWQHARWCVALALVALVAAVYFVGALACGGLEWHKCVGS